MTRRKPNPQRGGRPSLYTDTLATAICERLAEGETLPAILASGPSYPTATTVYRWLEARPAFRDQYARARERQADAFAARIVAEMNGADSGEKAQIARVRIDALKWLAGKLRPKVYGDRVATEHTGADGGPLQVTWIEPRGTEK